MESTERKSLLFNIHSQFMSLREWPPKVSQEKRGRWHIRFYFPPTQGHGGSLSLPSVRSVVLNDD